MHITRHSDYPDIVIHHNSDWSGEAHVSYRVDGCVLMWIAQGHDLLRGTIPASSCDVGGGDVPIGIACQATAMAVRAELASRAIRYAEQLLEIPQETSR